MNNSTEIKNSRTMSLETLKSQFYTINPRELEQEYYIIKCSKVYELPNLYRKRAMT